MILHLSVVLLTFGRRTGVPACTWARGMGRGLCDMVRHRGGGDVTGWDVSVAGMCIWQRGSSPIPRPETDPSPHSWTRGSHWSRWYASYWIILWGGGLYLCSVVDESELNFVATLNLLNITPWRNINSVSGTIKRLCFYKGDLWDNFFKKYF